MELLLNVLILGISFVALFKGADVFVDAAANIARHLGISELLISLTLVAVATSLPETGVSVIASFSGETAVSASNIVGSVIFNICVAFGIMILFLSFKANKKVIDRDCVAMLVSYLLLFTAVLFGGINWMWGIIFIVAYGVYLYYLYKDVKQDYEHSKNKGSIIRDLVFLVIGAVVIYLGSKYAVASAVYLARVIGVSEWAIGATVLAVGTSLPEFAVSIGALRKGKLMISLGNVIGSNVFDILVALGLSAIVNPILISFNDIIFDIWFMLISGAAVTLFAIHNRSMHTREGIFFVLLYVGYIIHLLGFI
ncbi:MAG: calcium/sodium antiporter [Candidatus Diapherotrites archaeon]|nr:calcium/sodium antiporter [Candidatus Diapherotrites archaeon]